MVLQGSGQAVGITRGRVECTYPNCQQRFVSIQEMRRHKKHAPEHDYCKKCDLDCADWEELLQHKVSLMDDFYRNRHSLGLDAQPAHITCEFCGEDFKSFGGRRGHREQMHPADQEIRCSGCEALFTRAGNFVAHLEQGNCPEISAYEFRASVVHKHILKEIFKDPGEFGARMAASGVGYAEEALPGAVTEGAEGEDQDQEEGGVNLLDGEHAEQKGGYHALEPDVDLMSMEEPYARPIHETWPRLPGMQTAQLSRAMRSMSINSDASSVNGSESAMSDVTSRRGGLKLHTESSRSGPWPSLSSAISTASVASDDDDTVSNAASDRTAISYPQKPTAWTGQSSKTLFKPTHPKPPPPTTTTTATLARTRQLEQQEPPPHQANTTNLLYLRFYDPSSPDYSPTRFHHLLLSKFCCPFPQCDLDECQYETLSDLEQHLQHWHLDHKFGCPTCLKRFASATAQVAHMESLGGKCRVRESREYKLVLDEITGGFLAAKRLEEPFIYKVQQALVVAGQKARSNGVMQVEYKAKMPGEQ